MPSSVAVRQIAINELTSRIIGAAMPVHSNLGPGLLEIAYQACLAFELRREGHCVQSELTLPVVYDGVKLDAGYRIDLLINNRVIIEVKAVESLTPIHEAQLLSYMKLSGKHLGLLINFNVVHLKDGIKRRVIGSDWKNN